MGASRAPGLGSPAWASRRHKARREADVGCPRGYSARTHARMSVRHIMHIAPRWRICERLLVHRVAEASQRDCSNRDILTAAGVGQIWPHFAFPANGGARCASWECAHGSGTERPQQQTDVRCECGSDRGDKASTPCTSNACVLNYC